MKIKPKRYIVWSKEEIDLSDPWQRQWYIEQVLIHGRAEDIKELDLKEVRKLLPDLTLPREIRSLWEEYFKNHSEQYPADKTEDKILRLINRMAIMVKPRKQFWDWVNSTDPSFPIEKREMDEHFEQSNVYLGPEFGDDHEVERYLEQIYEDIFEDQLNGWWTDESGWPQNRTYQMFREWFEVTYSSMVIDLAPGQIKKEDL